MGPTRANDNYTTIRYMTAIQQLKAAVTKQYKDSSRQKKPRETQPCTEGYVAEQR